MARKVNHLAQVLVEGVAITENNEEVVYLANTSADNLAYHEQQFIIPANTTYRTEDLSLRSDAVFTYFYEDNEDVFSEVTIKLNGNDTEFNVSPDYLAEEPITSVEAQNLQNQDRLINVSQLYVQGITYGQ